MLKICVNTRVAKGWKLSGISEVFQIGNSIGINGNQLFKLGGNLNKTASYLNINIHI